jgi:very-short-patch-repair endonuclease
MKGGTKKGRKEHFISPFLKGGFRGFLSIKMREYDRKLKQAARELRKNMTEAERLLWSKIRMKQLKGYLFTSQKPLDGYVVDFYCYEAGLVIEVDGSQHFTDSGIEYDQIRDDILKNLELRILRFTNIDVLTNIEGVVEVIERNLS